MNSEKWFDRLSRSTVSRILALAIVVVLPMVFGSASQSSAQDVPTENSALWTDSGPTAPAAVPTYSVLATVTAIEFVEVESNVHTVATVEVIDGTGANGLPDQLRVEVLGGFFADGTRLVVSHQPEFQLGATLAMTLADASDEEREHLGPDIYSVFGGIDGVQSVAGDAPIISQADASTSYTFTDERVPSFPVDFYILNGAPTDVEDALVNGAFEWDWATCSAIQLTYSGQANLDPTTLGDGFNTVGPSLNIDPADNYVAEARWSYNTQTGAITEWDIVFNQRDHDFSIDAFVPGTKDWQTVMRHEVGHVLGLGHSAPLGPAAIEEVMYEKISSNVVKFLGEGDRTGATLLYPAHPFSDVPPLSFFERPVTWLNQVGITTGTSPTTYSPNAPVTRAQMATFLYRFAGSPVVGGTTNFVDVPPTGKFYSTPVLWLSQTGITTGTSPTTFSPDQVVTRGQMATFLYRYAGSPAIVGAHPFGDIPSGAFYSVPVNWAFQTGITTGTSAVIFSPDAPVTRSQMATFLHRYASEPVTC